MGKKRIEMKMIDDGKKLSLTFTKRCLGLFKKAEELCLLSGADISVDLVAFSPTGKRYALHYPSPDQVFDRFPLKEQMDDGKKKRIRVITRRLEVLFMKARELSILTGADVSLFVRHPTGRRFGFRSAVKTKEEQPTSSAAAKTENMEELNGLFQQGLLIEKMH